MPRPGAVLKLKLSKFANFTHDAADIQIPALYSVATIPERGRAGPIDRCKLSNANVRRKPIAHRQKNAPVVRLFRHQAWECPSCGLELDSPERVEQKALSSLPAFAHLPQFHILLDRQSAPSLGFARSEPHPRLGAGRSRFGSVIPWNVVKLANKNLSIVDRDNNQIFSDIAMSQMEVLPQKTPESQITATV